MDKRDRILSKYEPLEQMLLLSAQDNVNITFGEIEAILGFPLPASAYTHRPWWANGGHTQASAWLNAGYKVVQVNFRAHTVNFCKSGSISAQHYRPQSKPTRVTQAIPSENAAVISDAKTLSILGYAFRFVQQLLPECDDSGRVIKYHPQSAYDNKKYLPLLYHGGGDFCCFSIKAGNWPGVYLWLVNGDIIYIGETVDLQRRFNTGYGQIAPRNCFVGGQSTNCKMNKVVLNLFEQGNRIDLYFYETPNYKQVELDLLQKIKTQYNAKDNGWAK